MNLTSRPVRILVQALLLAVLVLCALATRRHVLNAQRQLTRDGSIPFTLESALAFRRIQMAYRDGDLPRMDRGIQYPEGVAARETDTLGAERLYAETARLNVELMALDCAVPGVPEWREIPPPAPDPARLQAFFETYELHRFAAETESAASAAPPPKPPPPAAAQLELF